MKTVEKSLSCRAAFSKTCWLCFRQKYLNIKAKPTNEIIAFCGKLTIKNDPLPE